MFNFIPKVKEFVQKNKDYIVIVFLIISLIMSLFGSRSPFKEPTVPKESPKVTTTSELEVTQKETPESPDLIVGQKYVAVINDKKVEVPIKTTKSSSEGTTATLKQEIDVSSLVEPLIPDWELSVGLGQHDGDFYYPVSAQRNYKSNKAVRVELHIDKDLSKVNGYEVHHVWTF